MFGLALYVGEGSKAGKNAVSIANADVYVLRSAIEFFGMIGLGRESLKAQIQVHNDGDIRTAEKYWLDALGLEKRQLHKTIAVTSISSKGTKGNVLPYGTCHLRVFSTQAQQKLLRWMELALGKSRDGGATPPLAIRGRSLTERASGL